MSKVRNRSFVQSLVLVTIAGLSGLAASSIGDVFAQETTSSGDTTTTSDPAPVTACSLLTDAEAEAALGTTVSRLEDPGQCTFVATDGSGRSLGVAIPTGISTEHFVAGMEQLANVVAGELRAVAAGDEAYIVFSSYFSEGMARTGDAYVAVVLTGARADIEQQATTITDLMNVALSRR